MRVQISALLLSLLCSAEIAHGAADRAQEVALIPLPASIAMASGTFTVQTDTKVVVSSDPRTQMVAHYFGELLARTRGLRPDIVQLENSSPPKKVIQFTLQQTANASPESYQLDIAPQGIVVAAADVRGLFYGAVTLWQVLSLDTESAEDIRVPALHISDTPRLRWRGLTLDSARQFQSVEFVKRFIDTMALHKLNVLQWHLADDQAWRVEVRRYPQLTAATAGRFYTQQQVHEVVAYAAQRQVTIVPSFGMPGHAGAMLAAYPQLGATTGDGLLNADETTFAFIADVLREVTPLFPGEYLHLGSADFPLEKWRTAARVQARIRELGFINERQLYDYFAERVRALAAERGRRAIGWDQLSGGDGSLVMSSRGLDGALGAVAAGHDVVVSSFSTLNFNHRQSSAADEPPGRTDIVRLEDVYAFDPAPVALGAEDLRHLIGVQANVWTDHARTEAEVATIAFPRAAAVAEVAWSPASQLRWAGFVERLAPQMRRYEKVGIGYSDAAFRVAITARSARSNERIAIELSRQVLAGEIRYTLNGGEPTARSAVYKDLFDVATPTTVKAATFLGTTPLSATVTLQVTGESMTTARRSE